MAEPNIPRQAHGETTQRDLEYAHISSEPESLHRGEILGVEHGQNYENVVRHGQEYPEQAASQEYEAFLPNAHDPEAAQRLLVSNHYNFKGFVLFCFGTPGISPRWCSLLMVFYYMLLFAVGMAIAVLAAVALIECRKLYLVYSEILCILTGLLFLLSVLNGGCAWAWKTKVLPEPCTRSFLPVVIIAFLLALAHFGLMAALGSVLILSKYTDGLDSCDTSPLKWLQRNKLHIYWTIGALGVWAICFVAALIPAGILFWRKYRPQQEEEQEQERE